MPARTTAAEEDGLPTKWSAWTRAVIVGMLLLLPAAAQERYLARVSSPVAAPPTPLQSLVSGLTSLLGLTVLNSSPVLGQPANLYLISVPSDSNHDAALASLSSDPAVLNLEPDVPLALPEVLGTRNGSASSPAPPGLFPAITPYYNSWAWTGYVNQPAVAALNIPKVHQSFATGAGTVAFLDTGVDFTHPVLAPSLISGWDFTTNSPGGYESTCCQLGDSTTAILDDSTTSILDGRWGSVLSPSLSQLLGLIPPKGYGHGTMVAGLIHLAAPTARLMPIRVFNSNGTTTLFRIVQGIYYAVNNGANVINMSFSSLSASPELAAAIDYASAHGVISVSSVGNGGSQITVYPAGFTRVIGVASTDDFGVRSLFSNYGTPRVTLAAPGEAVITLYPGGGYAVGWGTSFSTPLVAGGIALLNQLDPADNQTRAVRAFSSGSHPAPDLGLGLIDLYQACLYRATHTTDQ
jgi:subtilisin family serine protease